MKSRPMLKPPEKVFHLWYEILEKMVTSKQLYLYYARRATINWKFFVWSGPIEKKEKKDREKRQRKGRQEGKRKITVKGRKTDK